MHANRVARCFILVLGMWKRGWGEGRLVGYVTRTGWCEA